MSKLSNIEILLSDARGIYIPRDFFQGFDLEKWHLKAEDLTDLNDPEMKHIGMFGIMYYTLRILKSTEKVSFISRW